MILLISQKNEVFEAIQSMGFSPSQFTFNKENSSTRIAHTSSNFYFKLRNSEYNYGISEFTPRSETHVEHRSLNSWYQTVQVFKHWLAYLEREIKIEDKWQRFNDELNSINFPFPESQLKFSASEFEVLSNQFQILKSNLLQGGFEQAKINAINGKLDYLLEQAKNMNKFDWKSLFIGTIISLIIQLTLSQKEGTELWNIIRKVFSNFLLP